MNKLNIKKLLTALVAVLLMLAMGAFKSQINGDRSFHKLTLEQGGEYEYTLDVGRMGIVKYLLEPNVMTLYLRMQVPDEVQDLHCHVERLEAFASQGSKKGVWKAVSIEDTLRRERGVVPLNLELAVPRSNVSRREVGAGRVHFYNGEKPYAVLNIKIVNSKI